MADAGQMTQAREQTGPSAVLEEPRPPAPEPSPVGVQERTLRQLVGEFGEIALRKAEWISVSNFRPAGCNRDDWLSEQVPNIARATIDAELAGNGGYVILADGSVVLYASDVDAEDREEHACGVASSIQDQLTELWKESLPANEKAAYERRLLEQQPRVNKGDDGEVVAVTGLQKRKLIRDGDMETWARRAMETMLADDGKDPERAAREAAVALPSDAQCAYRPMWHVKQKFITSFIAVPTIRNSDSGNGRPQLAYAANTAVFDLPLLHKSINELNVQLATGCKSIVVVPVHIHTVDRRPHKQHFADLSASITEQVRKHLVFELIATGTDLPERRIREIVQYLRLRCRSVIVRIAPNAKSMMPWKMLGIHAIGCDFSGQIENDKQIHTMLEKFAELAEESKLLSYVQGLTSLSATTAAVCAGFNYIAGDALPEFVDSLAGVEPFSDKMLFKSLFETKDGTNTR